MTDYKDMEQKIYSSEQLHVGNIWWYVVAKHEGRVAEFVSKEHN